MTFGVCPHCGALPCDWGENPDSPKGALAILKEAVALYGKPGGPWNVPSDPGGWLGRARDFIEQAEAERNPS